MPIEVIKADITTLAVDAIVNAANSSLMGGSGVDGAIHRKGGKAILADCMKIRNRQGSLDVGKAIITTAGNLPAQYVIHTVGPYWNGGAKNEAELLADCYRNSLELALSHELKSIAFPNISTGIYRFPKEKAAPIAIQTVQDFCSKNDKIELVLFVCFDSANFDLYKQLIKR